MEPVTPQQFRDAAHMLCELLETEHKLTPREWLTTVASMLATLVSLATRLPDTDASELDLEPTPATVHLYLPDNADTYWVVFDSTKLEQPVAGSLSDDLRDIHRELKRGLEYFEHGELDGAIFKWKFGYDSHWGRHAVGALRAIYCYLVS